jgi:Dolichyl-phosphate-mannose-protein mannosyltransferase
LDNPWAQSDKSNEPTVAVLGVDSASSPFVGGAHIRRFPIVIITAYLAMAAWTWGTWPDAMYDFGSQLYYAWQISIGKKLYVDIAYFNGPLSQYFNAAMFKLLGGGLRSLVCTNLAILAVTLWLIYAMLVRIADRFTATAACLLFICIFAFSQYVGIGNYNWVCPYTHEVTHGVALSLAMIAAMDRGRRNNSSAWWWLSGVLLGLVWLTKAEIFVPALSAVVVGIALSRGQRWRIAIPTMVSAIVIVAITYSLLLSQMPSNAAARALLGSWPWVFVKRIAQLAFYRQGLGIDDIPGNLMQMARVLCMYGAAIGLILAVSARGGRGVRWIIVTFIVAGVLIGWQSMPQLARPWPFLLTILSIFAIVTAVRSPSPQASLRAMLTMFALVLMGKMLLNARIVQYGFALAMPAAMVLVDALLFVVPQWITTNGGDGRFFRTSGAVVLSVIVAVHLYACHLMISGKFYPVGEGADRFLAGTRGIEVQAAVSAINRKFPSDATLEVMPQGLMLNYLARRKNPSPYVNLMPPEMFSIGEDRVLAALRAHPPGIIVFVRKDMAEDGFILTEGRYEYGQRVVAWVEANYGELGTPPLPAGVRSEMGMMVLTRSKTRVLKPEFP